jgi:hypothetical protein
MTPDGYLYRAQAALSCLGHIACFYDENADTPPELFGFGLSVILGYIEGDVTEAYNEITKKPKEEPETAQSGKTPGPYGHGSKAHMEADNAKND